MDPCDIVVVGAGATGAPLAARLSEDGSRRVLLLEAGPDYARTEDFPPEILDASTMGAAFPGHPNNWAFLGQLSPEIAYSVPRGRIIGGSTALNGTYFIRGARSDFERWEKLGNDEWSYEKVLPFFIALEDDRDYGDAQGHGHGGPIPVGRDLPLHPVTEAFFAACRELGFPYEPDKNADGVSPGYGPIPLNAVDGIRHNTALGYLNPIRDRANLTIRGNVFVRRVLFEGTRAVGVEADIDGERERIRAGEVILSAGAVKSPHILLLSGIGPAAQLEAYGVDVVADRPGVGRNFSDHPDLVVGYQPRRGVRRIRSQAMYMQGLLSFTATGSPYPRDLEIICSTKPFGEVMLAGGEAGPGGKSGHGIWGILRRPIRTLRSMRGVSVRRFLQQAAHQHDLTLGVALQQETSRGTIELQSPDPVVQPNVTYNYLTTEEDRARMREVVRVAVRLLNTDAFKPLVKRRTEPSDAVLHDDDALDRWARTHLATAIHLSGSCRMGADDDPDAVVDQRGRVYGVQGLRIADTSIFPSVTSAGPAATAIMVGERLAALIDEETTSR